MHKTKSAIQVSMTAPIPTRRRVARLTLVTLLGCGALLANSHADPPPAPPVVASAAMLPETAVLLAPAAPAPAAFGSAVAVSGRTVVIGAPGTDSDDDPGATVGKVYVYNLTATGWRQTQQLDPPKGQRGERFGAAVAISGDVLVVSAPRHRTDVHEGNLIYGEVYVFSRQGGAWQLQDTLYKHSKYQSAAAGEYRRVLPFGERVAISGNRIVASGQNDHDYPHGFVKNGATWSYDSQLYTYSPNYNLTLHRLVISIDNNIAVIGPYSRSIKNMGFPVSHSIDHAVVAFIRNQHYWNQDADVYESYLPGEASEGFGRQFAISGNTLAIGVPRKQEGGKPAPGAVDFYVRTEAGWQQQYRLRSPQGEPGDDFGDWLAMSGSRLVVGSIDRKARTRLASFFVRRGDAWHPLGTRPVPGKVPAAQATTTAATQRPSGLQEGANVDFPFAFDGEVLVIGTERWTGTGRAAPERATLLRFPAEG